MGFGLAFSRDGRLLVTASRSNWQGGEEPKDTFIRAWEVETGRELFRFDAGVRASCLDIAPDGRSLVTGMADTALLIWDLE